MTLYDFIRFLFYNKEIPIRVSHNDTHRSTVALFYATSAKYFRTFNIDIIYIPKMIYSL